MKLYKVGFTISFRKYFILIFLNKKLFLKQYYIKNKMYTFFFICYLLYKFGFFTKKTITYKQ